MFSYLYEHDLFLIATRNISILVKDLEDLQKIEGKNYTHKNLAKIWFGHLSKLNKATIGKLKRELNNHTWIGEYLTEDNLIRYSDEAILFHSIVDNNNGNIKGNAQKIFEDFGFPVVPSESIGEFILEEDLLKAEIDKITKQTLVSTITSTEEGVVLQLIDTDTNCVVGLSCVKSIEYRIFKTMLDSLLRAIENGEIDTQNEKVV